MTSGILEIEHTCQFPLGYLIMIIHKQKLGLSLIEILIVVGVIMLLSTIVMTLTSRLKSRANEKKLESTFTLLRGALEEYYDYNNSFPDPNNQSYLTHSAALYGQLSSNLQSRTVLEHLDETSLKANPDNQDMLQIIDPWGTVLEYIYVAGDNFPKLISAGQDKTFNTEDDIKY